MWGRVLLAGAGLSAVEDIVTAYPPIAFVATMAVSVVAPVLGLATPLVISALLALGFAVSVHGALRAGGRSHGLSAVIVAVLVLNPLFMRAVSEGPQTMLLLWGVWMLALGAMNLRLGERVNDLIMVALALVLLAFASPFGLVLAFAALPFLGLVIPPERMRSSPAAALLVIVFPLIYSVAAFAYVTWIFGGTALGAALTSEAVVLAQDGGSASVLAACAAFLSVAPLVLVFLAGTRGLPPLFLGATAMLASLACAFGIATLIGIAPPLWLAGSLGLPLAAACAARMPLRGGAPVNRMLLPLAAGLIGGLGVVLLDDSAETARWRIAMTGQTPPAADPELAGLAKAVSGRRAVLFDAAAAPAVAARLSAVDGLWTQATPQFQIAGLSKRTTAGTVVVRSDRAPAGRDGVARLFPALYGRGAPGYTLLFDGPRWRVYTRTQGESS